MRRRWRPPAAETGCRPRPRWPATRCTCAASASSGLESGCGRRRRPGSTRPDWINADLHIHSNYSNDCATSVETILETAREIGLGAIAIADHNEIEGAFLAKELCGGDPFVIVAEEVKTARGRGHRPLLEQGHTARL